MVEKVLVVLCAMAQFGCAAGAQFYSRGEQKYSRLTARAILCDEKEFEWVQRAGGFPIGTISAKAYRFNASEDDLAAEAALVAGNNGGTHLLLTNKTVETLTQTNPATVEERCVRVGDRAECRTTFIPETQRTYEKPGASFVVLRVPINHWAQLPQSLNPGSGPRLSPPSPPAPPGTEAPTNTATPSSGAAQLPPCCKK